MASAEDRRSLLRRASAGDAAAQLKLGQLYEGGIGVSRDHSEATDWYLAAAQQGLAQAQTKLGSMWEFGEGVPHDPAVALKWYSIAAEQGDQEATRHRDRMATVLTAGQLAAADGYTREWKAEIEESRSPQRKEHTDGGRSAANPFFQTVTNLRGKKVRRLKSSLFYAASLVALVAGIVLIANGELIGASLIMTLVPCLLLYPAVRFLVGGKDSALAVVGTVVIEEVLKHKIRSHYESKDKRARDKRR